MPLTLVVRAAIADMDQLDHSFQRNHRSPRQRHGLPQRSLAHGTLTLAWSIPTSTHLRIRSASFHEPSPCRSPSAFLLSPFLILPQKSDASSALTVFLGNLTLAYLQLTSSTNH